MRVDRDLAVRIERAFGASAASYARARAAVSGHGDVRVLRLRDGVVAVDSGAGGGENASAVFGLGLDGPVTADDVAALDAFYAGATRPLRVSASPFADPSLYTTLGQHGLTATLFSSMLASAPPAASAPPSSVDLRPLAAVDVDLLVDIEHACSGAGDRDVARRRALPLFDGPATMWAAFVDERAVACGALVSEDGVGLLFAGMCMPSHRGRGLQSALIRARLASAAAQGLDVVASLAAPGSTSERNLRAAGFTMVCTTSRWARPPFVDREAAMPADADAPDVPRRTR